MPAGCPGNSRQRSRGAQAPSCPPRGPPAPQLFQHCLGPPGGLSAKPPSRGHRPFKALGPWWDSGRAPWAEFRVTLGSSPAEHRPASAGHVCLQLCPPVSSRRRAPPGPLAPFPCPGEGARIPPAPPRLSPLLPCPAQGRLHREPLGGRGAGAGGVGVTSLPISDDREKQGEPVTGAEARRGADGPPSEPRLDRGRRGEGGVAEQAALTGEVEAGGARCESRAS